MIKDLQCKCRLFRTRKAKSRRWVIYSVMSIVAVSMLLATENAHAYFAKASNEHSRRQARATPNRKVIVGKASWYGQAAAGRKTATAERLDPSKLTAASTL